MSIVDIRTANNKNPTVSRFIVLFTFIHFKIVYFKTLD